MLTPLELRLGLETCMYMRIHIVTGCMDAITVVCSSAGDKRLQYKC